MDQRAGGIGRAQRDKNGRMMHERGNAQPGNGDEPDQHHGPEGAADLAGAERLHREQCDEDRDRHRQNERVQMRRGDLQAFDRREDGDRRGDGAVAVKQSRACQADGDDEGAVLTLDAEQSHQGKDAAFAVIIDAHRHGDIFERRDDDQRPDDERKNAQHRMLARLAGHVEHGLQCVERARADIAEDDAKRGEPHPGKAFAGARVRALI
jgi:hypothetical protein